jgi:signal transduction histidine kinase
VLVVFGPARQPMLRDLGRIKHEMSNPLMGLLGMAELLVERPDLPADARRYAETILGEARRLRHGLEELARLRLLLD